MIIDPEMFIIHQPRRIHLDLPGKRAFTHTTIMSIFTANFTFQIHEEYEPIAKTLVSAHPGDFIELTHGETGTNFCLCPRMFAFFESGCATGFTTADGQWETTDIQTIVSVMNSAVWVPIKGSHDEVSEKLQPLISWKIKGSIPWGKKNDA